MTSSSARDLKRMGKDGPDEAPPEEYYTWTDKKTKKSYRVPVGIDPGFDYNPGTASFGRTQALRNMDDTGPWKDLNPWGPEKYDRPVPIPIMETGIKPGKPATTPEGLRRALIDAIGGEYAYFTDPKGAVVEVNQAVVDHILEKPETRWDGREAFFPFIPDLIRDPYEIWISFTRSELSGRVEIRSKYVKAVQVGKNRSLGLWAEFQGGQWASGDFFRGGLTGAGNLRKGRMIYGKE